MPRAAKWLLGIVGLVFAAMGAVWLSAWIEMAAMGCTGNASAANRARALDNAAYKRLYLEAESMIKMQRRSASFETAVPANRLPPTARAIGARYAQVYGNDVVFKLSGCYDDQVFLQVIVADAEFQAEISLLPGETRPSEVLWPKPDSMSASTP